MTGWLWLAFVGFVGTLAALELGVLSRRPRAIRPADALPSMALWVLAAFAFSFILARAYDIQELRAQFSFPIDTPPLDQHAAWIQFITAYTLELVLSLDNVAVLVLLIRFFHIPAPMVPRLLFYGLIVALVLRWVAIALCGELLRHFNWMHHVLGGVLVVAMLRMLAMPTTRTDFNRRYSVRWARRLLNLPEHAPPPEHPPAFAAYHGAKDPAPAHAPSLLLVLIIATFLDLTYAADSIPALFAITRDPFIAFTASAFAVLGLRSMYLALAGVVERFRFLRLALVLILLFIAAKMFAAKYMPAATTATLWTVLGITTVAAIASLLWNRFAPRRAIAAPVAPTPLEDLTEAVVATRRNLRKVVILIVGTFIIIVGILIAPVPGPGPVIVVPIGLAILATEFIWARRLLTSVKSGALGFSDRADAFVDRTGVWIIPVGVVAYWAIALGVLWAALGLKWYLIAVIAGSPFLPIAMWAFNYFRKRAAKKTAPNSPAPGTPSRPR